MNRILSVFGVFFGALLFASLSGYAQTKKITVVGKVVDDENQPQEMIMVIGNQGEHYAETSPNGEYQLFLTPRDTLILEFRSVNHDNKVEKIPYDGKQQKITFNYTLTSKDVMLGAVTVTEKVSQRIEEAPVSMAVVQPKQVERMAATDLRDVMVQMPGVTMVSDQISIRGSSGWTYGVGTRVLGLMNGVPLSPGDRASFDWYSLPVDRISQVEVIKGSSSVLYGTGAMGGVINVITKDPGDKPETIIRTRLRFYDKPANPAADWDGRSSALSYSFNASHSRRIAQVWDFTILADYIRNNSFRETEREKRMRFMTMNKFRFKKVSGLVLGLNAQWAVDSTSENLFWNNYPNGALRPNPEFTTNLHNMRWSVDPSVSYVYKNMQFLYNSRIFSRSFLYKPDTLWKNEQRTKYKLISRNYGATVWYNDAQVKASLWKDRLNVIGGINYTGTFIDVSEDLGKGRTDQFSVLTQVKLNLGRWNFTFGARYQYEQISGDTTRNSDEKGKGLDSNQVRMTTMSAPIFRGGVNFRAHKATYLRASIGQAIRSPSAQERFTSYNIGPIMVAPNPEVRLEKGWSAEVGVRQLFQFGNKKFRGFVDLAAFTMQFTDMIEFWADEEYLFKFQKIAFKAQNLSKASVTGGELDGAIEYSPRKDFRIALTAGFTYIEPIDKNGKKSWNGDDSTSSIISAAVSTLTASDPLYREIFNQYTEFPSDRPYILKYRNKFTTRSSLTVQYKNITFTVLHRYTSHMVNVDKLLLMDLLGAKVPTKFGTYVTLDQNMLDAAGLGRLFTDNKAFRDTHNQGWHEFDAVLAYQMKYIEISFHAFNIFNAEYATLPGRLGAQRNFALQCKFEF